MGMTREMIGMIQIPEEKIQIRYYLFGSRKLGYGFEILQKTGNVITRECCNRITRSYARARNFGKEIVRGSVCAGFLSEVVSEWKSNFI